MASGSEERKGVESLKNFERALGHVRNSVRPLTLMSREEVGSCISAADRAKLNLQVAYGVSSLFYMFLKTQGISPSSHPVKGELDRIRGYFGRLKQVGKPPEQRTAKVDTEASRRFIDAALSGDSVWQNAKSTDPKSAQQRRASAGIGRSNPAGTPGGRPRHAVTAPEEQEAAATARRDGAAAGGNAGSGSGSKRKHAARGVGGGNGAGGAARGGATEKRSGGTGKSTFGGGGRAAAAATPQRGDGPEAAVPGESAPAAKKAKGTTGGRKNKKGQRYHMW